MTERIIKITRNGQTFGGLAFGQKASSRGLPVQNVARGSSAEAAGVLPGDLITSIQGQPIGTWTGEQCIDLIRSIPESHDLMICLVRDSHQQQAPPHHPQQQFGGQLYQEFEDRDHDGYDYDDSGVGGSYTQFGTGHAAVRRGGPAGGGGGNYSPTGRSNRPYPNPQQHALQGTGYLVDPSARADYDSYQEYADNYDHYYPTEGAQYPYPPQHGQHHQPQQQQGLYKPRAPHSPTSSGRPPAVNPGFNHPPPPNAQHHHAAPASSHPPPPNAQQQQQQQFPAPPNAAAASSRSHGGTIELTIVREHGQPLGLTPFKYSLVDCHAKKDGFNFNEMIHKTSAAKHYGGGLPVQFVVPNTAAMRAGVQPWDVILAINGQDIRQWTGDKCIAFLRALPADRNIDLRIVRSGGGGGALIVPQVAAAAPQNLPPPPNASSSSSSSSSHHHPPPPNAQQPPRAVNAMPASYSSGAPPPPGPTHDSNGLLVITIRRNGDPLGLVPFKYTLQDAFDGKDQLDYGSIKRKLAFAESYGGLPVQQVTEWAAAGKAGIKPMDVIVAVNGVYLKNMSGEAAINVIKGAPESQDLVLHIARSPTPIEAPNLQPVGGCCSCFGGGAGKKNQVQLQSIDAISASKAPMGTTSSYQQQPAQPSSSAYAHPHIPSSSAVPLSTTTSQQQQGGERWESYAL